jgi:glycosyltransferase involved in cell wall biosynthesis
MRLLIVSHTPHYLHDGLVVGWGATVREIDELATLFESVVHVAPLYPGGAPRSAIEYASARVRLRPVRPAGGPRLWDKVAIPLRYPGYARVILREMRSADVVHVRAPANISMLALVLLACVRRPRVRWAKYAGNWSGGAGEPWSYRFQRWWLARGIHRGVVTVNGKWPDQPAHVTSFVNPCLTDEELSEGRVAAATKRLVPPIRLLFVGRLESAKGTGICLETLAHLVSRGVNAELALVGEGENQAEFERNSHGLGVARRVVFYGGQPRSALGRFYGPAHFLLLPSTSEGWPKVLSEAMAFGVVPVASAVGSIRAHLNEFATGRALDLRDPVQYGDAVIEYVQNPASWGDHSERATTAAAQFSYKRYLQAVRDLLGLPTPLGQ